MKQGIDMTVNRLPARTWNRLGMNESRVADAFTETEKTAAAEVTGEGITVVTAEKTDSFDGMATGMGPDTDALLAQTGTKAQLVSAEEGKGAGALAELTYTLPGGEKAGSRLYLHAKKNSELNVAVLYASEPAHDGSGDTAGTGGLAALQTRIRAEAGARVRLYMAQTLADGVTCLNDIGAVCGEGASVELVRLELGAGKLYAGCETGLDGDGSRFEAALCYSGRPGQRLDMNYTVRHRGKKTESLIEAEGVLAEGGFKVFRGTIDLLPGCAGAKGTETENVLLLSDQVVNQTVPLILCGEEDVEGNHGATIGRLDERTLFYLASRGIPQEAAEQMIARARAQALADRFPSGTIRQEVEKVLCREDPGEEETDGKL